MSSNSTFGSFLRVISQGLVEISTILENAQAVYRNAPPRPFWKFDPSFWDLGYSPSKDQVRLKWLFPCCYLIRDVYRGHFSGQRFYTSMCMIGEFKSSKYRQLYLRAIHVQVVLSNCRKSLPTRIKRRWRRFGHLQTAMLLFTKAWGQDSCGRVKTKCAAINSILQYSLASGRSKTCVLLLSSHWGD